MNQPAGRVWYFGTVVRPESDSNQPLRLYTEIISTYYINNS